MMNIRKNVEKYGTFMKKTVLRDLVKKRSIPKFLEQISIPNAKQGKCLDFIRETNLSENKKLLFEISISRNQRLQND